MVCFSPQNRQYHVPKRCLLQDEKMNIKHKLLLYNNLRKALIIREFACRLSFGRKFALDFWGRTENSGENQRTRGSEKDHITFLPAKHNNADSALEPQLYWNQPPLNLHWAINSATVYYKMWKWITFRIYLLNLHHNINICVFRADTRQYCLTKEITRN